MNIESLPKWARERIKALEYEKATLAARLAEATGNVPAEGPHLEVGWGAGLFRLPLGENVRFDFSGLPTGPMDYIEIRQESPGVLKIRGSDALRLHPEVSNCIRIELA